jgi:enterochelin esterase family protein
MISRISGLVLSVTCFAAAATAQNLAGDEALSKVLVEGEGWQEVGTGYVFTDAACGVAAGNFYFADLPKGAVYRVSPDGKVSPFLENGPRISGLKVGPDTRFYACTQAPKKQIVAIDPRTKAIHVIADNVQPNDLAVSPKGFVYFTDTAKGEVVGVEIKSGRTFTAASGMNAPNGIALSPDSGTLAVSEYRGSNVWAFRVDAGGTLSAGARYMTLRTAAGRPQSAGDGMTVDAAGRYYVTSAVGIQMFDSTGRLSGVMARPQEKGIVSCAFAGPNGEYLYVCNADKVYRRKTQARAAWLFDGSR